MAENEHKAADAEIERLLDELTLEEQISLLSGEDGWSLPAVERLGIGKLRVTDGPNGARGNSAPQNGKPSAAFPVGISIGSSWNPGLAEAIGAAIAQEVKTKGAHVLLAPTVNIQRSVTNGRNFECYSEDPELTATLAVGYVKGAQGEGVATTIKHFAGNESEFQRTTISSVIDERSLREIYLRPFEDAVKVAQTWGIMTSYNRLNGTYTSEHGWLLSDVLRQDWGYDGAVVSDWYGSHSTAATINAGLDIEMPGPSRDRGAKLVSAVQEGEVSRETIRERTRAVLLLMQRCGALFDTKPLIERSEDRPAHRALIRRAASEGAVLLKNEGELLPLADKGQTIAVIGPNAKHARIMGGGSSQLIPHYQVSPWQGLENRIGSDRLLFADGCTNHRWEPLWHGDIRVDFFDNTRFSGDPVHSEMISEASAFWEHEFAEGKVEKGNFSARLSGIFTAERDGIHRFGLATAGYGKMYCDGQLVANAWDGWKAGRTFFEEGCDEVIGEVELVAGQTYDIVVEFKAKQNILMKIAALRAGIGFPMGDEAISEAASLAAKADTTVLFIGRNGEWDTEGSDLDGIALPGRQDELVRAVAKANPRTIVVLQTGGPVEMPWIDDVPTVLEVWYPGQEAGNAIADMLFGDVEPSGRLAQTFPRKWSDNPAFSSDPAIYPGVDGVVTYGEGLMIGNRHYESARLVPLFPFGHGLGYTQFALSDMKVTASGEGVDVTVTLSNNGPRSGASVAQIYVRGPVDSGIKGQRYLKAFVKQTLAKGEQCTLVFHLPARSFAWFDAEAGNWRVPSGRFTIEAGLSTADIQGVADCEMAKQTLSNSAPTRFTVQYILAG
ncbi:glycoside hydrolase family 3 C-terminal domain-containing protein [uncultured Cohaesibacter sp.]|uniref:beta-glucosidase n=1 Tax=uncultured Cohaesibacter sp. TaxID=1002546 RepID=UPI00292E3347|nr:glycoside hydrolase family 3 C-terminal domain-containing protein [uncultured Cohaesibacter sp.]